MKADREYDVILEPQPEGGYTAYVPDLPGCVSEGATADEAMQMIQEAMRLWLDSRKERGWPHPKVEHRKASPAA